MEGESKTFDKSMLFDIEDAPSDDSSSTLQYTRRRMQASTAEKDASADGEKHESENSNQLREKYAKKHTDPRTNEAGCLYLKLHYARDALLMISFVLTVYMMVWMTSQQTTDRNKIKSIFQTLVIEEGLASMIQEGVDEFKTTYLKTLEQKMTRVEEDNIGLRESMKKELADLKKKTQTSMQELTNTIDEIKQYKKVYFFLIAFMFLFLLVMFSLTLYKRFGVDPMRGTVRADTCRNNSRQILDAIPRAPLLDDAVCIISFYEDRQDAHKRLLDSTNLPNCRVVCHVVRRHDSINDIPRCKVYLMCVEFSERHVIIEEPGLGLGSLHRTTYHTILKLGGKLIILYTRDPGSRRLYDNERFNNKIYPATHQPELVELNNDGRFFSVYDELTSFQKKTLRQKITECMS